MLGAAFLFGLVLPPAILALLLASLLPLRWWLAAMLAIAATLLALLVINLEHGVMAMLPFLGAITLWMVLPAFAAAYVGARMRRAFRRKSL